MHTTTIDDDYRAAAHFGMGEGLRRRSGGREAISQRTRWSFDLPPPPVKGAQPVYANEEDYADPTLALWCLKMSTIPAFLGLLASLLQVVDASWLVWTYMILHIVGCTLLTGLMEEIPLAALCSAITFHAGFALGEVMRWMCGSAEASNGLWSVIVLTSSALYLLNFWGEGSILPPDFLTSLSFFFPTFPAHGLGLCATALEHYGEWRYFPDLKFWPSFAIFGLVSVVFGQFLMVRSRDVAGRNCWASQRYPTEQDDPEDFLALEIPDRRLVREGCYAWDRHPGYLGALLWGVGVQVFLCNPVMLLVVSVVLWAALLHVTLEEEQELYKEFGAQYAVYSATTPCHIPGFDALLKVEIFAREVARVAQDKVDKDNKKIERKSSCLEDGDDRDHSASSSSHCDIADVSSDISERPPEEIEQDLKTQSVDQLEGQDRKDEEDPEAREQTTEARRGEDRNEAQEEEQEAAQEDYEEAELDESLPFWRGVPRGGALWNRQFREPWLMG